MAPAGRPVTTTPDHPTPPDRAAPRRTARQQANQRSGQDRRWGAVLPRRARGFVSCGRRAEAGVQLYSGSAVNASYTPPVFSGSPGNTMRMPPPMSSINGMTGSTAP